MESARPFLCKQNNLVDSSFFPMVQFVQAGLLWEGGIPTSYFTCSRRDPALDTHIPPLFYGGNKRRASIEPIIH